MKTVILAGGLGTRLAEETHRIPKPMVEIGGKPILWHIMKIYSAYGFNDFVVCLGFKGFLIKEFFMNYALHMSDVTIDVQSGGLEVHSNQAEPWRITLVDTGADSQTGERLRRVKAYLKDDEPFHMTYGDGLADVDLRALVSFHQQHGKLGTVTSISPPSRWGTLQTDGNQVTAFGEKIHHDDHQINGGYFVLSKQVLESIGPENEVWEQGPMQRLTKEGQLCARAHHGFWQAMDTLREKNILEELWASGKAPWKIWA